MGQAIDYALSNWPLLGVFLEDGRIEIGNNLVENSIRPTALGKKNWLFFGDANAGERSVARQEKKGRGAVMGEDSLLERVTVAAEERQLSQPSVRHKGTEERTHASLSS
jgi:hypothetical protein